MGMLANLIAIIVIIYFAYKLKSDSVPREEAIKQFFDKENCTVISTKKLSASEFIKYTQSFKSGVGYYIVVYKTDEGIEFEGLCKVFMNGELKLVSKKKLS